MKRVKSLIFTLLVSGIIFGILHFIPIEIGSKEKKESNFPIVTEEEELLGIGEDLSEEKIDIPQPNPIQESTPTEEPKIEIISENIHPTQPLETKKEIPSAVISKNEEPKKQEEVKANEDKKLTDKKTLEEAQKQQSKIKSKIGVDRKLISGIPGTMKYKGSFPPHNVKEKGSITISYVVDQNGNVISAYRTEGLRDRNTINNAISLVKKHVKAEKGKENSTGTYTIDFK